MTKNRVTKLYLLMLAMPGIAYAIAIKDRFFITLTHFCLLQNINNKHKNT